MNLPRRAVVRPFTSCLAAAALAATALVPVAASASPVPAVRSGSVASSVATTAASVAAVRAVTPPRAVTKKQLVRIFRAAARATEAGLRRGAALRSVEVGRGARTSGTGRARAGRILLRESTGSTTILDSRTGSAYVSLATITTDLGVSQARLDAALVALGKPGATWGSLPVGPTRGGAVGPGLVRAAKAATSWSWRRSKGITTWRLSSVSRMSGLTLRSTQVFVLDAHQRLVRQSETSVMPESAAARRDSHPRRTLRHDHDDLDTVAALPARRADHDAHPGPDGRVLRPSPQAVRPRRP